MRWNETHRLSCLGLLCFGWMCEIHVPQVCKSLAGGKASGVLGLSLIQSLGLAVRHLPLGFLYKSAEGGAFLSSPCTCPLKSNETWEVEETVWFLVLVFMIMSIVPSYWACDEDNTGMNFQSCGKPCPRTHCGLWRWNSTPLFRIYLFYSDFNSIVFSCLFHHVRIQSTLCIVVFELLRLWIQAIETKRPVHWSTVNFFHEASDLWWRSLYWDAPWLLLWKRLGSCGCVKIPAPRRHFPFSFPVLFSLSALLLRKLVEVRGQIFGSAMLLWVCWSSVVCSIHSLSCDFHPKCVWVCVCVCMLRAVDLSCNFILMI